jgi:hypothetical protein
MRAYLKAPNCLLLAAAALVVSAVVILAACFTWFGALNLGVNLSLAWLLVRGSRVAWVLVVLSEVSALGLDGLGAWWEGAIFLLLFTCLLLPSSLAYVWRRRESSS